MQIPYATCEQVSASLEVLNSAYATAKIYNTILAASRSAEGFLHRRFYPELRTVSFDWPTSRSNASWEIDLEDQELISLTEVQSGGTVITSSCILRRGDDLAEPPYSTLAINLTTSAAFSAGSTWQQAIQVEGLFGANDTDTSFAGAALSGAIGSTSATSVVIAPSSGELSPGIGSLLLVDSERMLVLNRRMSSVGITTSQALTDLQSNTSFTTAGASSLAIGETILIDSERMRIKDIAGSTVIVERAYDGTVLGSHSSGSTIYGLRTLTVKRGVLGSTAATHSDAAPVYVHEYPPLLNQLVVAETIVMLEQNAAAYARTIGTGAGTREAAGLGLDDVRERAYRELGRKQRSRAI